MYGDKIDQKHCLVIRVHFTFTGDKIDYKDSFKKKLIIEMYN